MDNVSTLLYVMEDFGEVCEELTDLQKINPYLMSGYPEIEELLNKVLYQVDSSVIAKVLRRSMYET